jgi:hypothetical protein
MVNTLRAEQKEAVAALEKNTVSKADFVEVKAQISSLATVEQRGQALVRLARHRPRARGEPGPFRARAPSERE